MRPITGGRPARSARVERRGRMRGACRARAPRSGARPAGARRRRPRTGRRPTARPSGRRAAARDPPEHAPGPAPDDGRRLAQHAEGRDLARPPSPDPRRRAAWPRARRASACRCGARGSAGSAGAARRARGARRRCPACGPPRSLSPEKVTTSAPAATVSGTVGSCGSPQGRRSRKQPEPRSSITGTPRARPSSASSAVVTLSVKPTTR